MSQPSPPFVPMHMSPDEFQRHGHAVVDWIAQYMRGVESRPVLSSVQPGEIRARLPQDPPEAGEPFEAMLRDVEGIIMPGITHWQSPNFFAYFPSNNSGPSILGELLSAGLGVQGMLWATSPACTELETHVLDWLADMLGLPSKFKSASSGGGVIQDTASSATLCALLAARERSTQFQSNQRGIDRPLVAYASTQAHSSVEKAMMIAGLGRENLRLIEVDGRFAMRADLLRQAMQDDMASGKIPFFICAAVGSTSSNAIDPVRAIGELVAARFPGVWLHVDAAMSGTAALCPELRFIHDGLDFADSYCFNPHKWMFTNFDCDCFYIADRAALIKTLSVLPEYLRNQATASGAVFDYRDWQIPLGRRFRALKLWFVIRHYGVKGLQQHIREHVRLAQLLAEWVRQDHRFELVVDPPLNLVCFRLRRDDPAAADAANQRLLDALNGSGRLYLTHTRLHGRLTLRMSIGQSQTQEHHVRAAWRMIQAAAADLQPAPPVR